MLLRFYLSIEGYWSFNISFIVPTDSTAQNIHYFVFMRSQTTLRKLDTIRNNKQMTVTHISWSKFVLYHVILHSQYAISLTYESEGHILSEQYSNSSFGHYFYAT